MLAAQEGHAHIARKLLIIGANIWTVDDEGDTLMHKAVFNHHSEVVHVLLEAEKQIIATLDGKLVERRNYNGDTALHMLARKAANSDRGATQEILIMLLASHADPKAKNQNREKFLHAIAFYGRSELYPALMGRFPRLPQNSRDLHGLTPLHKAVLGKSVAMMDHLCSGGAKIESEDDNEMTPLLLAVHSGFWEGARYLLRLGANPKHKCSEGKSLFHHILERAELDREGYGFLVDCIQTFPKLLLCTDSHHRTPLHTLAQYNHHLGLFILRFLPGSRETNEEFVSAKDKDGRTAYNYANDHKFDKLARHIYAFPPESLGADYQSRTKPLAKQKRRRVAASTSD